MRTPRSAADVVKRIAAGLPVPPETVLPDVPVGGTVEDFEQAAAGARDAQTLLRQFPGVAGLSSDDALRRTLLAERDITTLSATTVERFAAATGHVRVRKLVDSGEMRDWIPGRQLVDLLQTYPVTLSASQLQDITRKLPPRAYSIASSRKEVGDEAHLLVSAVRYAAHGRERSGVASVHVADRLGAGATVRVRLKPNPHFRLPDPAAAARITWTAADLTGWEPTSRFDLVTSHYVHVPGPPEALFARLASWVAPGGTLLVVGHGHAERVAADGPARLPRGLGVDALGVERARERDADVEQRVGPLGHASSHAAKLGPRG